MIEMWFTGDSRFFYNPVSLSFLCIYDLYFSMVIIVLNHMVWFISLEGCWQEFYGSCFPFFKGTFTFTSCLIFFLLFAGIVFTFWSNFALFHCLKCVLLICPKKRFEECSYPTQATTF